MKVTIGTLAAAAVAATLLAAPPSAHSADLGAAVLKHRQDAMKALGGGMKAINDGLEAGDVAAVQAAAQALNDNAQNLYFLFVPGTGIDDGVGKTAAKMEIWADWAKFTEASENMEAEAAKVLAVAEGGDAAAIGAAFGDLGKNGCGGCHSAYRLKQE